MTHRSIRLFALATVLILSATASAIAWVLVAFPPVPPDFRKLHGVPSNTTELEELGNGWCVFTVKIQGVERTFLRREAAARWGSESLVELRGAKAALTDDRSGARR